MSKVRVLVGTKNGAFILTADGKRQNWDVSGPHFAGWEMYHLKGSPADPNRIYARQHARGLERSRGLSEGREQQVSVRRRGRHAQVLRRLAASVGVQAHLAC